MDSQGLSDVLNGKEELRAAKCQTQRLLFLSKRGVVLFRANTFNPWSIAVLYWNVGRKLGHIVQTTGSKMKGDRGAFCMNSFRR